MFPRQSNLSWPPPLLAEFVRLFNEGRYWHAHEVLETAWRAGHSPFYRGLIIYASAFVHAQRGNPRGVVIQLEKAIRYLSGYPPGYLGIDVQAVLARARSVADQVRSAGMPEGEALRRLIPWPRLSLDPNRVGGTEPELTLP